MRLKCAPAQGALRVARMGQYYSLNPATVNPQWSRATLNGVEDTMGPQLGSPVRSRAQGSAAPCPNRRLAVTWPRFLRLIIMFFSRDLPPFALVYSPFPVAGFKNADSRELQTLSLF